MDNKQGGSSIMKIKMNKYFSLTLIFGLLSALTIRIVSADTCERKIIMFNEDVTQEQIDDYISPY